MRNKSILEKPVGGTSADVADAIAKKHTQNTDTALGAVGTKNPPIDADKALYRDSTASDALVTSTWTQIKAFLKTYFDTLYNLYVHPNHSGEVTSVADGATTIAANAVTNAKAAQMATKTYKGRTTAATGNVEDVPVATVKTDLVLVKADVGLENVENTVHSTDAHTMTLDGRDVSVDGTKLDGIEALSDVTDAINVGSSIHGVANKATPVDADKVPLIDTEAANVLKTSTWTNIKAFLKTYFDGVYAAVLGADDNYVTDAEKSALHAAATVADTDSLDLSLTGQQISGVVSQSWLMARSLFR